MTVRRDIVEPGASPSAEGRRSSGSAIAAEALMNNVG
jgi:hypothetical protein